MGGGEKGRGKRRGEGRAQILAAAREAFSRKGYAGASTAGIARAAGVTQPLVHHHFGSKQKLWDAVLSDIFGSLQVHLAEAVAQTLDAPMETRLREMLKALVRFSGHNPELSHLMALESANQNEHFDRFLEVHIDPWWVELRRILSEAIEAGVVRPDFSVELAPFVIIGGSVHLFMMSAHARKMGLDPSDPETIERYADQVVEVMFQGLKGPEAG